MGKQFLDEDISLVCEALGEVADDFADKTILLAGGGGFLGRYFEATFSHLNATRLKNSPARVILVDNLATVSISAPPKVGENVEFVQADVTQPRNLTSRSILSSTPPESRVRTIIELIRLKQWTPP